MKNEFRTLFADAAALVKRILDLELVKVGDTAIHVSSVLIFVIILIGTFWISRLLQRAIGRVLRRGGVRDDGSIAVLVRLLHYVVVVVGASIGLSNLGLDLGGLFAAGALFAVAIGFAMQNITQNFMSGVILLVERTIKPGDVLEVDGRLVRVQTMGIRSTIVRTLDEEDVIVPNADLAQTMVKNYTLRDPLFRIRVPVGVAYESDMRQVDEVLRRAADEIPWRNKNQQPRVQLIQFGDSSVVFEVSVWVDDPWRQARHRSDLHHVVWWALKNAGITIAFPQLDLHLDRAVLERRPEAARG